MPRCQRLRGNPQRPTPRPKAAANLAGHNNANEKSPAAAPGSFRTGERAAAPTRSLCRTGEAIRAMTLRPSHLLPIVYDATLLRVPGLASRPFLQVCLTVGAEARLVKRPDQAIRISRASLAIPLNHALFE